MKFFWKKEKSKNKFKCSVCGKFHTEIPALGFQSPYYYDILSEKDKLEIAEISDDFCVINHNDQIDRFI